MQTTELLTLRRKAYVNARDDRTIAAPRLRDRAAHTLSTISDKNDFRARCAITEWLFGEGDALTNGEARELISLFPVSTPDEIEKSRALFADMLEQIRTPA